MVAHYAIHNEAYWKIVLHALKYPHLAVNGLLVGSLHKEGGDKITIVDAVPVAHGQVTLGMVMEAALLQTEAAFQDKNLRIVGYYHANERQGDRELPQLAKKLGDKLGTYFSPTCVLLVDNMKLTPPGDHVALRLYTTDARNQWRLGEETSLSMADPNPLGMLKDHVAEHRYHQLHDFEDHLEDVTRDWLNRDVFT
eukprot:TRINITY_DN36039_c0_g1_i1.p2 TRINITY_DN36039_c0_g1~~TRINITY_DN36039_c0_g1_i1.p2  ORF type:complete len:203 (-),score=47.50 TRINITY_DN36039_c0_g1_i1:21-608(-)